MKVVGGGDNAAVLVRPVVSSSECNPLGSTSTQQEKVRMITSRCITDECTSNPPACAKMVDALSRTSACATECNYMGSMSLQQVQFQMGTSCYGANNCTLSTTLPTQSSTLNGLVCPSCVSANSTWCYTDDTIQCTGNENMCLFLQSTQESGSMSTSTAFRGCATKSLCDLGSQSQNKTGLSTEVKFNCTRASITIGSTTSSTIGSISVHKVVLTQVIVFFLLLKLIF
ncbi:phospholipase A2 inhibitor 25 kDa subunit-like [Bufo bufo]|uniref:phospholipase A2 inhibitor 25 kDa subunit-like n=1 Tax=Bufo bufo TaxID=8384 RepID=UPI001ABE6802|nr:phospholipase A2 inhibitor 25 kDa subunit-like [Bufo bufo]